jgi:gamma-glutamyl-gamma-aminobutyrate hydrolase PuuD
VEAIEDPRADRFALGVQWHPELGWMEDRLSQALFSRFIAATRKYAGRADVQVMHEARS